jgi:hypothetical protein
MSTYMFIIAITLHAALPGSTSENVKGSIILVRSTDKVTSKLPGLVWQGTLQLG